MPAEQALRPQKQDEQHRKEKDEIREFRQERLAEIIDEAHNDAADELSEQAAGATKNDDHQRQR